MGTRLSIKNGTFWESHYEGNLSTDPPLLWKLPLPSADAGFCSDIACPEAVTNVGIPRESSL